jgi:hypothetical protein
MGSRASTMNKQTAIDHQDPNIRNKLRRHLKDRRRMELAAPGTSHHGGGAAFDVEHQAQQASILGRMYVLACNELVVLLMDLSLTEWNSPFGPLASAKSWRISNREQQVPTPPGLIYHTPSSYAGDSPRDAPSPLTSEIQKSSAQRNSKLLVQGNIDDLLRSLSKNEMK